MSENKVYELLFETASEGLIVADQLGKIELANETAARMFGYTVEELKEANVDDLLPSHLRSKHAGYRESYAEQPRKRPMGQGFDLIGVRKDGSSIPIEISLNYYKEGEKLKVMALIMDVTTRKEQEAQIKMLNKNLERRVEQRTRELKESQQLYRLIARNFPNGTISVFDDEYQYVFVEGQELYKQGITSERLMGKSYLQQLPEEVREEMRKRLDAVLQGQNLSFELEHKQQHYLINTVGLTDEDGKINRILMVEQNITERKQAEEKVMESLEKERQLNELKSRFVSMASHEFRTPLSTVLSSLSLIEKYDAAEQHDKKPKHFQRIRNAVRHLTSLLNDFLSLEKVETGKVNVNLSTFSLKDFLTEIVEQHQEIAKEGQHIALELKDSATIHTDQNMLRIIISNLLSNAVKYSSEGDRILLNATVEDDHLLASVQDEGIGIPLADQQNMFSRFFRAQNALNLEGTGLGLNIVERYLQLLGGDISFESKPNEGTTFYIDLPIQVVHE